MAVDSGYQKKRKKRKKNPTKKLLIGEQVEVLYNDEGLSGSWHSGTVVEYGEYTRVIEYTNLLSEDNKLKLKESIQVSSSIEGLRENVIPKYHRNNIRPLPPYHDVQEQEIIYGLCVDVLLDDVWWEGVVFDRMERSDEWLIFFPDEGDQQMVGVDNLRLSQDWNELTGHWKLRGTWLFLQALQSFEQEEGLPVSVREIWFDLRSTDSFMSLIGVWIFGNLSDWNALVLGLMQELRSVVVDVVAPLNEFSTIRDISNNSETGTAENDVQRIDSNHSSILALEYKTSEVIKSENCDPIVETNKKIENHEATGCDNRANEKHNIGESWKYVDLEAAYFPDAVKICASDQLTEKHNVILKAKKHLLFLGWKIAVRRVKTITRIRYISPKGKSYYSLKTACSTLLHSDIKKEIHENGNNTDAQSQNFSITIAACNNDANSRSLYKNIDTCSSAKSKSLCKNIDTCTSAKSKTFCKNIDTCTSAKSKSLCKNIEACSNAKPQPLSKTNNNCNFKDSDNVFPVCDGLEPESFPESPLVYKTYADMLREKGNNEFSHDLNMMRLKVRKHLKYMGWKFWIKVKHRKELFITSPCGKRFKSLYLACDEYLKERGLNNNGKCIVPALPNYRENRKERNNITGRNVIPSRRKNSTGQGVTRTLLSSLIDSNLVQSMQKVYFIRKRDRKILKTGQITRDGIKCTCCRRVFNLSNFEVHAGSTYRRAAANIFLEDGRSLLQCQREMIKCKTPKDFKRIRMKCDYSKYQSDSICSVCHDVGELVLCDYCPSSFHLSCLGLETVPDGKWFCPACRCGICGTSEFNCNTEQFTGNTMLYCDQCEREYHAGCMRKKDDKSLSGCPVGNWFCSNKCSEIFHHLRRLLGVSKPTSVQGLSCTILRSRSENGVDNLQFDAETLIEHESKLCVALNVMHECFVDIMEPRTQSDFVADLLFNRESELRRLNLYGFYTMLLEKGDELVSVAAFRVHGEKVAEMPFIGTCVKYRRQGMCRLLISQLEMLLLELGVKNFILPAVPLLLETWASFGFKTMSSSDRLNFLEHTIVNFQDTKLCWKVLSRAPELHVEPNGGGKEMISVIGSRTQRVNSEIHNDVPKEAEHTKASLLATRVHLDTLDQSQAEIENSSTSTCTILHKKGDVLKEAEPMKKASLFATRVHLDRLDQSQTEIENSLTSTCIIPHKKHDVLKKAEPMKKASLFATRVHLDRLDQSQTEIENSPTSTCIIPHKKHDVLKEAEPMKKASLFASCVHLDTLYQSQTEIENSPTSTGIIPRKKHDVLKEAEPMKKASLFATRVHLDRLYQSQTEIENSPTSTCIIPYKKHDVLKEAEPMKKASLFATRVHLDRLDQSQTEIGNSPASTCIIPHKKHDVSKDAEPMKKASLFATRVHLDRLDQSQTEIENSPASTCIIPHKKHDVLKEAELMKKASLFATCDHLHTSDQNQAEIENSPTSTCIFPHEKHYVVREAESMKASLFASHTHLDILDQSQAETENSPTSTSINPHIKHDSKQNEDTANRSLIIALKAPMVQNLNLSMDSPKVPMDHNIRLWTESPKPAFIIGGMVESFKHVYKRRKLSANKLTVESCS